MPLKSQHINGKFAQPTDPWNVPSFTKSGTSTYEHILKLNILEVSAVWRVSVQMPWIADRYIF
jgi:hypothetical protein